METKEIINKDDSAYIMLYRFLKENGILSRYLNNIITVNTLIPKADAKTMLKEVVHQYRLTYGYSCQEQFQNLFNWAPSSFYWNASKEGEKFWRDYFAKWIKYYRIQHEDLCNI